MFSTIILAAWVFILAALAEHMLNCPEEGEKVFSRTGQNGWTKAAVLGLGVGFANYFAPHGGFLSVLSFIAVIAALGYICKWFMDDCNEWKEFLVFVLMTLPICFTLAAASTAVAVMVKSVFWKSVLNTLPKLLTIAMYGFMVVEFLFSKHEDAEESGDESKSNFFSVAKWIALILAIILLLWALIGGGISWKSINWKSSTAGTTVVEPETGWKAHFYNLDNLKNDTTADDFNFGPNPLEELLAQKVAAGELTAADLAGKSLDELYALFTTDEVDHFFRSRLGDDPALGAATMAYFDSRMGTRFLGVFYDECEGHWDATINSAKEKWADDQEDYYRTLSAFFAFLDTSDKIEIVKVKNGLDDQMYMNPYTVDHVPDVIVMETLDHDGYFIRYNFSIKGEHKDVAYRIDCGFQPTNVSKEMDIPVQKKPSPTPSNPPSDPTPGPTTPPDNPTPGPTTPPSNPKDPTKGPDVGKNDDPGPGPNTNNGVGATSSSEDKPTNSTVFDSYDDYKQEMEDMKNTNEDQKVGGDSNTPSTTTPPNTNVDSNADKGNGYGGIDDPTPTHNTHVGSNVGGSSSVTDDPPGQEWGGPPD